MGKLNEMQRLNEQAPAAIRVRGEYAMASETEALRARVRKLEKASLAYGAVLLVFCVLAFFAALFVVLRLMQ